MDQRYKSRYDKFIFNIASLGERNLEYSEKHHIIPKCMNGTNHKSNLIKLTAREHYIAHWILWKAYPTHLSLTSAFLQMTHKNVKDKNKQDIKPITGRAYHYLKKELYDMMKDFMSDKVFLKDDIGNQIVLSKKEYKEQTILKFVFFHRYF